MNRFDQNRTLLNSAAVIAFYAAAGYPATSFSFDGATADISLPDEVDQMKPVATLTSVFTSINAVNSFYRDEFELSDHDQKLINESLNQLPSEIRGQVLSTAKARAKTFWIHNQSDIIQLRDKLKDRPVQNEKQIQRSLKYLKFSTPWR